MNEIINFQHRHDNNSFSLNPDVFPVEIDEIISHFFNKDNGYEISHWFADNHSPKEYLNQYLIVLFLRNINEVD